MKVGDEVELVCDIYEHADDHSPGGYLARKGETLVIRRIYNDAKPRPFSVSHRSVLDCTFLVDADEIKAKP